MNNTNNTNNVDMNNADNVEKLGLLIGCPQDDLPGPENDVKAFATLLANKNFKNTIISGDLATRAKILDTFDKFVSGIPDNAVVVIYYAGHGGIVKPPRRAGGSSNQDSSTDRTYQFLDPVDFEEHSLDFRGILDVEISYLLHRITNGPTRNVTIVLDCCHSGRLARAPSSQLKAIARGLRNVEYRDMSKHVDKLVGSQKLKLDRITSLEGNPHVVRVVAAATSENAYEYPDGNNKNVGALTTALIPILGSAIEQGLSWRSVLTRACELVNIEFKNQHPHVEGPSDRKIFSLDTNDDRDLLLTKDDDGPRLNAGRISGMRVGNVYTLSTPGRVGAQPKARATVSSVEVFVSRVDVDPRCYYIPPGGVTASLLQEANHRWPVRIDTSLHNRDLSTSRFLRNYEQDDKDRSIAEIHSENNGNTIVVYSGQIKCAVFDASRQSAFGDAVKVADQIARAQNLLVLIPDDRETLENGLDIEICRVIANGTSVLDADQLELHSGDRVTLNLRNKGSDTIHVSVFDVDVLGEISHLSRADTCGVKLEPGDDRKLYSFDYKTSGRIGLPVFWAGGVPTDAQDSFVPETIVFLVSKEQADLRDLCSKAPPARDRGAPQGQYQLARQLGSGGHRGIGGESMESRVQWDIKSLPFKLRY